MLSEVTDTESDGVDNSGVTAGLGHLASHRQRDNSRRVRLLTPRGGLRKVALHFTESEGSLLCLQELATCFCSESDQSSQRFPF